MTTDVDTPAAAVAGTDRAAGYTGLGIAEFVALAMHENTPASAVTLALLELADPSLVQPEVLAYGRSSLVARGLLTLHDDGTAEPAGVGRLVAHAAAHATRWLAIGSFEADRAIDGALVALAPQAAVVLVRRPLLSIEVAPAKADDGPVELAWDAIERQFAAFPRSAIAFTPATLEAGSGETLLIRHARLEGDAGHGGEADLDESSFEVAIGTDFDDRAPESVRTLGEDELDALLTERLTERSTEQPDAGSTA